MELGIENVLEISKIGFGRCKIVFKHFSVPNAIIDNEKFRDRGLTPKIFAHFVSKTGIVFDIRTDISEDEFLIAFVHQWKF